MIRQKTTAYSITFFLILVLALVVGKATAQLQWPVEATNADHPIGNSCGEFQQYRGGPDLHTGIDIREDCAPSGPWVRSVTGGTLTLYDNAFDATDRYNGITIVTGTTTYRYWHLDHNSIQLSVRNAHTNGTPFPANTRMCQIVDWTSGLGNFHHLHFDIIQGGNFLNPLSEGLTPENDNANPEVEEILICRNNSNTFLSEPASGCWIVDGDLDIIARASDTDPPLPSIAWQGHIGVYRIEYSINELTGTGTHNVPTTELYEFDSFTTVGDGSPVANVVFKNVAPADSDSTYWINGAEQYYYIVTNVDSSGNLSEASGYWDTDGGGFPDGLYQLNVTAYDFIGNHHTKSEIVFVQNSAGSPSPVEFFIRDRNGDDGSIPSNPNGEAFWRSPDIRVDAPPFGVVNDTGLPFGSTDHENPIYNQQNRVYVRVHNLGCTTSGQAQIHLYWADPSGGLPASAWNEIEPAVNKFVNNVPPGGSVEYNPYILWTPTGTAIGHSCLLVRLESTEDPIVSDYDIPGENNIGQKNITVVNPSPGVPQSSKFLIMNPFEEEANICLIIDRSDFPNGGKLSLTVPYDSRLFKSLSEIEGVQVEFKEKEEMLAVRIWDDNVTLCGFYLSHKEQILTEISLVLPKDVNVEKKYAVDITQKTNGVVTGGLTFVVPRTPDEDLCPPEKATYQLKLAKGINFMSVPLEPDIQLQSDLIPDLVDSVKYDLNETTKQKWRLSDLASYIGKELTYIVWYNNATGKFVSYFPDFPVDSPANKEVAGGDGYLVFMKAPKTVTFVGEAWSNTTVTAAPSLQPGTPVLVLDGLMFGDETGDLLEGIKIVMTNLRTGRTVQAATGEFGTPGRYTLTFADTTGKSIAELGDTLTLSVLDAYDQPMIKPITHQINRVELETGLIDITSLTVPLTPEKTELLANYPNPFNPETWIPFRLSESTEVSIEIYDTSGKIIRTLNLDYKEAGNYLNRTRAAYWDGCNSAGESVASGIYFYGLRAGKFMASRKMIVLK